MAKASILEITRRGEEYMFIFTPAGKPLSGASERACPVRVPAQALDAFCRAIHAAAAEANQNPQRDRLNTEAFVMAGRGLFLTLLPDKDPLVRELLTILRRLRTPLLIKTDDSNVFWELLFDESHKQFFGLRFKMSRCLRTRGLPSAPPRRRDDWRWLLISSPAPDKKHQALAQAANEGERLRNWLKQRRVKRLDYLEGPEASFDAVLTALASAEYDVIHFAGHTGLDRKASEYGLVLHGGRLFSATSIRSMVRGSPIVFLNGCWSGSARGIESASGSAEGLTDAFLAAGAQLVVGSLFEAPDAGARAFAERFYEVVLAGEQVGEAMRQARHHVQGKAEYGPAWACFVMYGDPCLRFNITEDKLQILLQSVGLSRQEFEASCLRVVEQALEYGAAGGIVATPHLFAAMFDGEDRRVRACIQKQGIQADMLRDAFTSVFKTRQAEKRRSAKMSLSDNVEAILKEGRKSTRSARRDRISEADLIAGFVAKHGGMTSEILDKLGVNVADFLTDLGDETNPSAGAKRSKIEEQPATQSRHSPAVGEMDRNRKAIDPSAFTLEAWAALQHAEQIAAHAGSSLLGTPHLFLGMLEDDESPLAKALRRLGVRVAKADLGFSGNGWSKKQEHIPTGVGGCSPQLSQSVSQILMFAAEAARAKGRDRITAEDLLTGFVRQGGGKVGQMLRSKGVIPEALTADFFTDSGAVNRARISPEFQWLLQSARNNARETGQAVVGRRHLLWAMLAAETSLLSIALRKQGADPAQLAELLFARLPRNPAPATAGQPNNVLYGPSVISVLCQAEAAAVAGRKGPLSEARLLIHFLQHLPADLKDLLIQGRVRWRELMQKAEALANDSPNISD